MKCLTLFLHAAHENGVVDCLRDAPEVPGFSLSDCRGHSAHTEDDRLSAALDRVEGYVPRVRVEVMLEDEHVEPVLERLARCTHALGTSREVGAWFVADVTAHGRL